MRFQDIKDIKNKIHELVENAYVMGHEDGLKDGKESVQIDETEAYECGLNGAWEYARKIYSLSAGEIINIFGGCSTWVNYSASEAIAKIKEYEEKQAKDAEIKVGDEVIYHGRGARIGAHDGAIGVVLGTEKEWVGVRFKSSWNCVGICKDKLTKTGRHFPQIEEVLEQMKGE